MRKVKTPRQKLIKKLDELVSKKVREQGFCTRCGKTEALQCAHIFSRRNHKLRWNMENLLCLCYACHIHWAHKEPILFTKWVQTFRDVESLEELMQANSPIKVYQLEELYESLKHL